MSSSSLNWNRYRDIVLYRAYAELKAEAELNYMGYVWWLLEPLLNTILFYIILAAVVEQAPVGTVSFLLVGAVTWQWFSAAVLGSAGSIFDAGAMLKHIYLPKVVLPLIAILTTTWKFLFVFTLLLAWVWATARAPGPSYAALPLIMLLQLAVTLAISLPVAVLMPYVPDARIAVDAVLRSLMLVSGIFFSVEKIPAAYHVYFYLNPMAVLIEAYRAVLLEGHWPSWEKLAYVAGFSAIVLAITAWFYVRLDRSLVKAINR
jgi:lipopolysaccharide transport system permease protein